MQSGRTSTNIMKAPSRHLFCHASVVKHFLAGDELPQLNLHFIVGCTCQFL